MPRISINTIDNKVNAQQCDPGENLYHFMAGLNLKDAPSDPAGYQTGSACKIS